MSNSPLPAGGASQPAPIVVGVDGSDANHSAIVWATEEAERSHRGIQLVTAIRMRPATAPIPDTGWFDDDDDVVTVTTDTLASAIATEHPTIPVDHVVKVGDEVQLLIAYAEPPGPIVVGQRGIGAFERMTVGSVSIGVAGRSAVPVVIVPDGWDASQHLGEPIVVGVDLAHPHQALLDAAFARASALRAPLVIVSAWLMNPLLEWSAGDIDEGSIAAGRQQDETLADIRAQYPEVAVTTRHPHAHRAGAVLDAASDGCQMIVLGRKTKPRNMIGFGPSSMTRTVLHYTTCPVLVIPS